MGEVGGDQTDGEEDEGRVRGDYENVMNLVLGGDSRAFEHQSR